MVALTGALLVAVPGAASARSVHHRDARGDVATVVGEDIQFVPAPGEVNGDILRTRLRHTSTRVRVRIKFLDLHKADFVSYDVFLRLTTNEGVARWITLHFSEQWWRGSAWMTRDQPYGARVRCAVHKRVDDAKNVVVLGFPRTCLKRPRWLRIGIQSSANLQDRDPSNFSDDAFRNGPMDGRSLPKLSRRLYRGRP